MCNTMITRQDELSERLFIGTIHTLELFSVYLGKQLGLYEVLNRDGALSVPELAAKAGIAPRYAREWLEQQAVAGFLQVDDTDAGADSRKYTLPSDHAGVLAEDEHEAHVAPFAQMLVGIAQALPEVVNAYRTGEGVPYEHYGADFRHGQGAINRPAFSTDLIERWLPAVPDLHDRLQSTDGARIADIGCGEGWSTIALAQAYPDAEVVGYDLDRASVETARKNAQACGVDVTFVNDDATKVADGGTVDLALILEALHDMSRPDKTLEAVRQILTEDGSLFIADERVSDRFAAPGDEIERMMYGWSISHCLPISMTEQPSAAIGTVIRSGIVEELSQRAGYGRYQVLPIENDLFRFYRLQR